MGLLNTVAGISVFTVQRPLFKIDRGHKRENKEHLQLKEQINMLKYSQKCWGGSYGKVRLDRRMDRAHLAPAYGPMRIRLKNFNAFI